MNFQSPVNPLKIPLTLSVDQPPAIKYVPPGNIGVSSTSYCGDGDVQSFGNQYQSFDFLPSNTTSMDTIAGYWIVGEGESVLPTPENWFPVAYQKVPMNGTAAPFKSISQNPTPNLNLMTLIGSDLVNVYQAAKDSFGSTKKFSVFTALFSCVNPDDSSKLVHGAPGAYAPSAIELVHSLKVIDDEVNTAFNGDIADIIKKNKIKITLRTSGSNLASMTDRPKPYTMTPNDSDGENLSGTLFNTSKAILDTVYPTLADDATVSDYISAMASSSTALAGFNGDKIAYCNAQGATSNKDSKIYDKYEPFPLNLACKSLFGANLAQDYADLFSPGTKPDSAAFMSAKKKLAKRFYTAAAYEAVQKHFQASATITIARSGCFKKPSQDHLIHRLVASYPLNFAPTATSPKKYVISGNQSGHLHPEYLFAIRDKNNYFAHEELAIWGQVTLNQGPFNRAHFDGKAIILPLGSPSGLDLHPVDASTFRGTSININFKARHKGPNAGGACRVYC